MTRRAVAALVLAGLLVASGCLGFVTGEETLAFESDPVSVGESAREDTGYTEVRVDAENVTRNFTVAGQNRTVVVTNHVAEYSRTADVPGMDEQDVGRFTVYSTPKVEIAGQTLNPIAGLSPRDLAGRLQQQYSSIENVAFDGNRTVQSLGERRTVTRFTAEAQLEGGQSVNVYLHVAKFEHGDDFVVAVGVHPQLFEGGQDRVDRLLGGVQHQSGNGSES